MRNSAKWSGAAEVTLEGDDFQPPTMHRLKCCSRLRTVKRIFVDCRHDMHDFVRLLIVSYALSNPGGILITATLHRLIWVGNMMGGG
jgi:hypothetical protein